MANKSASLRNSGLDFGGRSNTTARDYEPLEIPRLEGITTYLAKTDFPARHCSAALSGPTELTQTESPWFIHSLSTPRLLFQALR